VVLDQQRRVRYSGRVDDQFSPGSHKAKAGRQDLAIALEEILAGKSVSVPRTEPAGCLIERAASESGDSRVTYHREIAPILNRHCVACHRPGGIGPFSLLTAAGAGRWSA